MAEPLPVLIVGAGPVGLSASLLLSDLGVENLVVERNPGTTDHPKAHVVNTRTMEIFRSIGVAQAVRDEAVAPSMMGHVRWVRSIAGQELAHLARGGGARPPTPSPATSCAQDKVEQILHAATVERPGSVQFDAEVSAVEPDDDGVTVTFQDGRTRRAAYVIAADGASSGVRRNLGIDMEGLPELLTMVGIYFHADLRRWTENRPALLYWVMNSAAPGTFIALDGLQRWVFHLQMPPGETPDVSDQEATEIVRRAIGDTDVAIDVRSVKPWRMTAQVAERYRQGRVFLAGDAAHRFPPTGGLGLNTGVQDVHNLAWKLARVLAGSSTDSLLDTYEEERKPIAQQNSDFSVHNALAGGTAVGPGVFDAITALEEEGSNEAEIIDQLRADIEANRAHFGSIGMDLGFSYGCGALIPEDGEHPSPDPGTYVPSGRPGGRAPHLPVSADNPHTTILDRFGRDFVLAVAGPTDPWNAPQSIQIPAGEPYGLDPGGAVLIRPDGHIAWRTVSEPDDPSGAMAGALARIGCRS
ncbi:MAG: FAD-dependent monooxygenase [Acidimicrobiales bacterium]